MLGKNPKVVFFGAGVIGGTVGAWLSRENENTFFIDQGVVKEALAQKGLTLYPGDHPEQKETYPIKVIDGFSDVPDPDIVVVAVKNYSLDAVSRIIRDEVGIDPIIVGMQNGLVNQQILAKYFSKVIYCVVSYNAWMDEPGVIGFQKKGPLHFGTKDNELQSELNEVVALFNKGVETHATQKISDAAHCKLVINLTNSVTTLIGLGFREIEDRETFQKLLSNVLWEGVQVIKAAGTKESKLGGMPSWLLLWLGAHLPRIITGPMFEKNVKKMVVSSMAQDVLQRKAGESELDTINGYLVQLADKHGVAAPYNRAIYQLCKEKFADPNFQPMDVGEVWRIVNQKS